MSENEFQIGDTVKWTSQAAGTSATKKGTIIEVVRAGAKPVRHVHGIGGSRNETSYVVEVPRAKSVKNYWPRVASLKKVKTASTETFVEPTSSTETVPTPTPEVALESEIDQTVVQAS